METKNEGTSGTGGNTGKPVPPIQNNNGNRKRKTPVGLIVLTILLALAAGALGYKYYTTLQQSRAVQHELQHESDSLSMELRSMVVEYEGLKTDNDSMNMKLDAQQEKIKNLLNINASNLQKIRIYQKELSTLREVMKSYIVQIDSLNQQNIQLTAENVQYKSELKEAESTRKELEKQRKELSGKVEVASVLNAKNIVVSPLNKRSKERDKVKHIEKIRVCFTLRENPLIEPGTKDIYIRIIRPDDMVLTSAVTNLFEYKGEQIVYSAKRQVEYENKDVDMCIYWDNNDELIGGTYTVDIFSSGNLIGTTQFVLED